MDRKLVHGLRRHRSDRSGERAHRRARRHPARAGVQASTSSTRSRATGSPATTSRSVRRATCRSTSRSRSARSPATSAATWRTRSRWRSAPVRNPDGSLGFFSPANFTFGQPVYLSRIYAAVEDVEGVESATVTVFHRHGRDPDGRARERPAPDRRVGDRAARQRPEQHGERHADHHGRRRLVSGDPCGCCTTPAAAVPAEIENRPWLSAIAYRIGTFATFRKAIIDELSHTAELAGSDGARERRLHDHGDRAVGGRRRRAHVLPGAHRERGVPAHGDAARLGPAAGPPDRLSAAAGRRGHDPAGFHARAGRDGADSRGHARPERAGGGREAAEVRDAGGPCRQMRASTGCALFPFPPALRRSGPEPPSAIVAPDAAAIALGGDASRRATA